MKTRSEAWTVVEAALLIIAIGSLLFDIVGVFGLAFAITGMLIAFAMVIGICLKRPAEGQAQ